MSWCEEYSAVARAGGVRDCVGRFLECARGRFVRVVSERLGWERVLRRVRARVQGRAPRVSYGALMGFEVASNCLRDEERYDEQHQDKEEKSDRLHPVTSPCRPLCAGTQVVSSEL